MNVSLLHTCNYFHTTVNVSLVHAGNYVHIIAIMPFLTHMVSGILATKAPYVIVDYLRVMINYLHDD